MKKRALSIILCVAMVISMTACGDSGKDDDTETQTNSAVGDTQKPDTGNDEQTSSPAASDDVTEPVNGPAETKPAETEPTASPEELSEEEMEFREIFWYNGIQPMLTMHADGMSDEEVFTESDKWNTFEKSDGMSAIIQMIKDYFLKAVKEFDALDDESKAEYSGVLADGSYWGPDPFTTDVILSINLKDAYKDFETRKADYLEKYNAGEQSKEDAFSSIEVVDNVLFDENGVTITYTGAVVSNDNNYLNFGFHITNNNPDNKRATVMLKSAAINGILFMTDGRRDFGNGDFDILVGEEKDLTFEKSGNIESYTSLLPLLGESIETLPVETLSFLYTVKIGKDSTEEVKLAELKTTKYSESDISGLFGTCVAEGKDDKGSEGVAVYVKSGDFGVTATAVSTRDYTNINYFEYDVPYAANVSLSFNGNVYTGIYGMAPDELSKTGLTYSAASATVYPGGAAILCSMNMTDDIIQNLRREYEVGNSEPVEITLNYLQDRLGQPIPAVIYSK